MYRGLLALGLLSGLLSASAGPADEAAKLYASTDYEASLRLLTALPEKDAHVFDLIGRNYFRLGDFKKASEAYEKAVAADPSNSDYENWLGRAYGKRAETSSPFTAPGLASKARQHFERAFALNPRNRDAIDDLFEYYLEAPGFLAVGSIRRRNWPITLPSWILLKASGRNRRSPSDEKTTAKRKSSCAGR
jgi:tetratricopeptide (TPR) repeat protein